MTADRRAPPLSPGWRSQLGSYVLLGAAVIVFAACLVLSFQKAATQHESELQSVGAHLRLAFQADYAMQRLRHALDLHALGSEQVDHDLLLERFRTLSDRLPLLVAGPDRADVRDGGAVDPVPAMIQELARLEADVTSLQPGDRPRHARLAAQLNGLADRLHRLVLDVNGAIGLDEALRAAQRRRLYLQEASYLAGMLVSGAVFVFLLLREARRTRRLLGEATTAQVRIEHLAHHDPLTDLPNRWLYKDRLDQALRQAQRDHHMVAMHCVDIDHFKSINDRHGHLTGDQALVAVAGRMQACLRQSDTLARLGGDEFAIVQTGLGKGGATQLAERLVAAFRVPLTVDGTELNATISIGIALYPAHATTAADLHRAADTALYYAKAAGRDRFHLWQPGDDRAGLPVRYQAVAG